MAEARRCGVARALFCRLLLSFFFSTPSTPSAIRRFHFRMATTAVRRACGQDVWTTSFWGASPLKSCAPTVYYSDRIGSNGEQTCSRSRRWCIVPLPVTRVFPSHFFFYRALLTLRRCRNLISQPFVGPPNCPRRVFVERSSVRRNHQTKKMTCRSTLRVVTSRCFPRPAMYCAALLKHMNGKTPKRNCFGAGSSVTEWFCLLRRH